MHILYWNLQKVRGLNKDTISRKGIMPFTLSANVHTTRGK